MNKNKFFFLLLLIITVNVSGQSITNSYKFKLNRNPDSTWAIAGDMDSLVRIVNRFSGNYSIDTIELIQKLQDTMSSETYIFKEGVILPPNPDIEKQLAEKQKQLAEKQKELDEKPKELDKKQKQLKYLLWGTTGLLLLILSLLIWGIMTTKSKRKIQRKQQQGLKDGLLGLLSKHFEKKIVHIERRNVSPDELVDHLAQKQKELKEKQEILEKSLEKSRQELSEKDLKIKEHEQKIEHHNKELKKLEDEFKGAQAGEKERINSLCVKMIERKNLFVNSLSGLDENPARKELVRFSFAYAEMAVAVLDEIRGKNSESGKMNIRLLNGSKENFGKTFDQHSPENAIDRVYILIAKIFSDLGIESIEDVYFNGDKFQQKK